MFYPDFGNFANFFWINFNLDTKKDVPVHVSIYSQQQQQQQKQHQQYMHYMY